MEEPDKIIARLYELERQYQISAFGEYQDIHALNLASFLVFLEKYLKKAKEAYAGKWEKELPPWLQITKEYQLEGSAPVEAYAELIKVMALAGAALETFAVINPDSWRTDPNEASKWKD
jgi:hypothetical protein